MVLDVQKPQDAEGAIIEAWAQGYMVGSLIIMACVTVANMRKHVLLHKLILVELIFGMFHGTFIFANPPAYNWYLSVTAILLNTSWSLHNVIAWIKNKPFLPRWGSTLYITTVILVQPYWILEIVANFLYFSNTNALFVYTRPYEALFRDPWWIFTALSLFYNIKSRYEFGYLELIRVSPRFAILLGAMLLSICFIILDILAVTKVISSGQSPDGINPFWKLAFVFKCLTDTMILDDFKTALDRLKQHKMSRIGSAFSSGPDGNLFASGTAQQKRSDDRTAASDRPLHAHKDVRSARDWTHPDEIEDLDLESALRTVKPEGQASSGAERHAVNG